MPTDLHTALQREREACATCGGGRTVPQPRIETATREMALDAGDPALEGEPVGWGTEWVPCPDCTAGSVDAGDVEAESCEGRSVSPPAPVPTYRYYPGIECEHGYDCCPRCDGFTRYEDIPQ